MNIYIHIQFIPSPLFPKKTHAPFSFVSKYFEWYFNLNLPTPIIVLKKREEKTVAFRLNTKHNTAVAVAAPDAQDKRVKMRLPRDRTLLLRSSFILEGRSANVILKIYVFFVFILMSNFQKKLKTRIVLFFSNVFIFTHISLLTVH